MSRDLTPEEAAAIRSLKRLAKKWPRSLTIFGWNGSMCVMDTSMNKCGSAILDEVSGIPCDGGDPDDSQ
jgi:hypothetical protein